MTPFPNTSARPPRLLGTVAALLLATGLRGAEVPRFSRDILPILSDACFACHGPDERARKAGLRLDTLEGATAARKDGPPAIVPGDSAASGVLQRLTTTDPDDRMPPPESHHPVSARQIGQIREWIDGGAVWGRHWAFEPPARPAPPRGWPHPVDAFVRSRLAQEGFAPAPEAPRATLIRRLSLDLTGLPPTPAEVAAFEADPDPDSYGRLVDRLLASPRFGERMAWDWMEAARYADSNGYQGDGERTMWPWRDWVVDAFNRNLPFDRFTLWQVAGDRLPDATYEQRLATGFLRNHMINGEGGRIPEENRIDYLFDQTETVATVWLGATFNCTRCHDHKYDPFTQRDYYGLLAFFNRTRVDGGGGNPQTPPVLAAPSPAQASALATWENRLEAAIRATEAYEATAFPPGPSDAAPTPAPVSAPDDRPRDRDPGRLEALANQWTPSDPVYAGILTAQRTARLARDGASRAIPRVMVMEDLPQPRATFVLSRGNYLQPGEEVPAALPASLGPSGTAVPDDRLGLARWLVDPANPLTARVTVNRFWQGLFGIGLVKTAEDFGVQGERPSHPELLDWLAVRFVESGWDVKGLLRLLVTSDTYRQSSVADPDAHARDPENRLLARGARFRMPSWMIRDTALAAAGLLVEAPGGAPVKPYQPPGVWEDATFGNKRYQQDHGTSLYRRGLYVFWRRIIGPTLFFDVANRQTCTVRNPRTNVPLHALLTLNDVGYVEAARRLAEGILRNPDDSDSERLARLTLRVLSRRPSTPEEQVLIAGLARHRRSYTGQPDAARQLLAIGESPRDPALDPVELAAWTLVASTVLNLDEALTRE